jgi:hypothetical protein
MEMQSLLFVNVTCFNKATEIVLGFIDSQLFRTQQL